MENQKHTKLIWPIGAPFKIAYRDPLSGFLTLLPYIDLQWKMKIWGIAIDQRVYKLTHEAGANWDIAMSYADKLCHGYMPNTDDLDCAYFYKKGFDEIIEFLKSKNIAAEKWNSGWYWSRENNKDRAVVVDMADGKAELIAKNIKNGYVRLVSHRIAKDAPQTVRYPLVYLEEGIFKVSYDIDLSHKNQLWGIQFGKKYFCLRQETELLTWYQAREKAQQMSTDLVRITLPKKEMFEELVKYRDAANDALMKLQAYGIATDLWEDKSWGYITNSEWDDCFVTYCHEMIHKDRLCPCRFIGENRKGGTIFM